MSRELKFRVFDKKQNKFLKIRDFIEETWHYQFNGVAGYGDIGISASRISENGEISSRLFYDNHRFKIQQFTGLYDKHGTEIYEGDIIDNEGWKADIEFCEGKFVALNENDDGYLERLDLSDIAYSCKVIGNIFENSELLWGGRK